MISKQDIQKLAELARIEVTDSEVEHLQRDLEHILAYVAQLDRAETGAADVLINVTGQSNVVVDDAARAMVEADTAGLLHAAPRHDNSFVKVLPVWKKR